MNRHRGYGVDLSFGLLLLTYLCLSDSISICYCRGKINQEEAKPLDKSASYSANQFRLNLNNSAHKKGYVSHIRILAAKNQGLSGVLVVSLQPTNLLQSSQSQ